MPNLTNRFTIHGDTPQRPVTPRQAYDPAYWRRNAARVRVQALAAADQAAAEEFERAAADYDRLAARAEAILVAAEVV
jgi:hypothetical protein